MRRTLLTTILFLLSSAARTAGAADASPRLQALVATSGEGVERLLDGDEKTGWRPDGDPVDEGVLFRFEEPLELSGVEVRLCPEVGNVSLRGYLDGVEKGEGSAPAPLVQLDGKGQAVFLRIMSGRGCISEVSFRIGSGKMVRPLPPRLVRGTLKASSVLTPPAAYLPAYLFDGRLNFGWAEGQKGPGTGASLTLTLEAPIELVAVELWNGYQRSDDHFKKNARAKRITVAMEGKAPVALEVKDVMGAQRLALPAGKTLGGKTLTLTVRDVYKGSRYQDLVLSELRLWDGAGPLQVATGDLAASRRALEQAVKGKSLERVLGHQWETWCEDEERRSKLKLRSNHSFVWYSELHEYGTDDSVSEVFDGAWTVKSLNGPWATLSLFGRRHRTETTWEPYSDDSTKESERIGGGTVEVARLANLGAEAAFEQIQELRAAVDGTRLASCAAATPEEFATKQYPALIEREAIFVFGTAMADLLVRPAR